jgi:YD repeat-containing protein
MRQFLTIIFLILLTACALAQPTIEIYLTNHSYPSKGSAIESIEETYELMIQEIPPSPFKVMIRLDKTGKITSETKYGKAGGKQSETNWEYDQNQKLTKKTHRYFVNMLGWRAEETSLKYNDTTGYIAEIRFIKNGVLQSTSKVFCDSLGSPFDVRVLDDNGAFSTIEKIGYSPSANLIRVMILKSTSQFISRWLYPIDPSKPYQSGQIERQYYPNGEVMLESLEDQTKIDQGYFYEYTYDGQGNWVEKDTYQVSLGKNSKIKNKKLEHKIMRTIKYY